MNKQNKKIGILLAILILIISISSVGFAALQTGPAEGDGMVNGLSGNYEWYNAYNQRNSGTAGVIDVLLTNTRTHLYGFCIEANVGGLGSGNVYNTTSNIDDANILKAAIVQYFRTNMTQQDGIDLQIVIWHVTDGIKLKTDNQRNIYQQANSTKDNYNADSYEFKTSTSTPKNVKNTTKTTTKLNNTIITAKENPFINGTGNWSYRPISYQAYNTTLDGLFQISNALYNVTQEAAQEITNLGIVDPNTFNVGISNTSFNNSHVTSTQEYINGELYNITTYYFEEGWEAWWNTTETETWENKTETTLYWDTIESYKGFWFGEYDAGNYQNNIVFNMSEWNKTLTNTTTEWDYTYSTIVKGITGYANFYRNWTNVTYIPLIPDVPSNPENPENPENPDEPSPIDPTPTNPSGADINPDNPGTGDSSTENPEIPSTDETPVTSENGSETLETTEEPSIPGGIEDPDEENTTFEESSEDIPMQNTAVPVILLILSILGVGAGYRTIQYRKKR